MQKMLPLLFMLFLSASSWSQSVATKLKAAFEALEKDPQLSAGIASVYVINSKTGEMVYEKNGGVGLATASTMKVITAASAYELLGKEFTYKTVFAYTGGLKSGALAGDIIIRPSGDPTLGSWRWRDTKENVLLQRLQNAFKKTGIKSYQNIWVNETGWEGEAIPDGWMWQDIGNYYGAGAAGLNWRENQYDLFLSSGTSIGSAVVVAGTEPAGLSFDLTSVATAAAKGTGDNAYIYYPLGQSLAVVRGTIPVDEKSFKISGAIPNPGLEFGTQLIKAFAPANAIGKVTFSGKDAGENIFHTETSPPLDSIIYWFNKRSINLYGEALVKTIGLQKKRKGDTDEGVEAIKAFWKSKGLDVRELSMVDGSGLSPLNRVTTHAQVFILQHAQKQPWFDGFYHSLPEYNGMKLKSGTIRGVKGFCGYHKSSDGTDYIVSILVNNYNGSASTVVQKMYKVLDVLK